jgi:thiol-disulfide isomerase/thioredoxin
MVLQPSARQRSVRERSVRGRVGAAVVVVSAVVASCGGSPEVEPYAAVEFGSGGPVAVDGLRGDVVLLAGWATWCIPCERELPELDTFAATADADLRIIAVNVDNASVGDDAVAAMVDRLGVSLPIWRDPDGRLLTHFGGAMMPFSVLLGRDGSPVRAWNGAIDVDAPDFLAAVADALA